jgi:GNAT superfamily N-acetyltransferase
MSIEIVELDGEPLLEACVAVIREAFATVAAARGLTETIAPTHPSFMTAERLRGLRGRGARLFAVVDGGRVLGCAALEASRHPGVSCLERLAVLPAERHRGLGRALVAHAAQAAQAAGAQVLSIGIIDDEAVLKRWYEAQGFAVTGTRRFEHLPFTVCYMQRELDSPT